jgi:hypothetical protein
MKRRKFVGMGGLAISSLAVKPENAYSNFLKNSNTVKVGVIGTGGRGNWLIKLI